MNRGVSKMFQYGDTHDHMQTAEFTKSPVSYERAKYEREWRLYVCKVRVVALSSLVNSLYPNTATVKIKHTNQSDKHASFLGTVSKGNGFGRRLTALG